MARLAPDLDFLPRSPWSRGWPYALLLAGVLACLATAVRHRQADELRQEAAARLRPPAAAPAPVSREAAAQAQEAQAVAAALAVPWDAWFRALESVAVPGVFLTALQPDAGGRRARISGQAPELASVLAYMERLGRAPGFGRVLLLDHAIEDASPPQVRFTLSAQWEAP